MTTVPRFQTFEDFWPYYVAEHSKPLTRRFHFVGTTAALLCVGGAVVLGRPSLLLGAAIAGYGPAWTSHFFIEKNRPATLTYPKWSLAADLVMWRKMIDGTMDAEVERVMKAGASPSPSASSETANGVTNGATNGAAHA